MQTAFVYCLPSFVVLFVLHPLAASSAPLSEAQIVDLPLGAEPNHSESGPTPIPSSGRGAFVRAVAAFRAGDMEACRARLRDAVAENPTLPAPDLMLAEFYLEVGDREAARRLLEQSAAVDSSHAQLYLTFGRLALAEGRLAEALLHFEKMEALGPPKGWSAAEKEELEVAIVEGKTAVAERRGNWDAAHVLLAEWVQLQPNSAPLRHRWASALLLAGREREAYEQFDIAHRQDPQLNRPEASIGAIYADRGQFDKANAFFLRAIQAHPEDGPLNYAWAMALLYQGRSAEAQEHARKAASTGLDSIKLNMLLGLIARDLGQHEEAELHFKRIVDRAAGHDEAKYHWILALTSQDSTEKRARALELAEANLRENPQSPWALAAVGAAQLAEGKSDRAEQFLSPLAQRPDAPGEALYLFGQTLVASGKSDLAREIAQRLRPHLDQPGIFVGRAAAREWLANVLP